MTETDSDSALLSEALERFHSLWREARTAEVWEPDAMSLATADAGGRVSVRTVLLKEATPAGFVFFSNYESRKGRELAVNARAALCFLWKSLRRQVTVEGVVAKLPAVDSDRYFATRDRLAQLGAWASEQSRPLASRAVLEERVRSLEMKHTGQRVPRPPAWGGYRLLPDLVEFWAPVAGRLNERERYRRDPSRGWCFELIYP